MRISKGAFIALVVTWCAAVHGQPLPCEKLKQEIKDKIIKNGVKSFELQATPNADVEKFTELGFKVIGTCEGGSKKIIYKKGPPTKPAQVAAVENITINKRVCHFGYPDGWIIIKNDHQFIFAPPVGSKFAESNFSFTASISNNFEVNDPGNRTDEFYSGPFEYDSTLGKLLLRWKEYDENNHQFVASREFNIGVDKEKSLLIVSFGHQSQSKSQEKLDGEILTERYEFLCSASRTMNPTSFATICKEFIEGATLSQTYNNSTCF